MYRCWIEFIEEKGTHRLYYANGCRKRHANNMAHELVPFIGTGLADAESSIRDGGTFAEVDHGPSWIGDWIDEWVRVYGKDGKVVTVCTMHVRAFERTPENTNKDSEDCDIDFSPTSKEGE